MYETSYFDFQINEPSERVGIKRFDSLTDAAIWWFVNAEFLASFSRGRSILTNLKTGEELHYIADKEQFEGTVAGDMIACEGRDLFSCFEDLISRNS
jgi:hypothetical protein